MTNTTVAKKNETTLEQCGPSRSLRPAVDLYESTDAFHLTVDLPGVAPDDLKVELKDKTLRIEGLRKFGASEGTLHRSDESLKYERSFRIGQDIESEKIQADLRQGVLHLTLAKAEEARPKQIEVQYSL
jgi:HSP20 family molecular chaperone IbpA